MKRQIVAFWTGDNPMPEQRSAGLKSLRAHSDCDVLLVTPQNLHDFVPAGSLHPAYPYLNLAHRSDYLRCYFMKNFGGGYSDIKPTTGSWQPAFARLETDPNVWMVGYPETGPGGIANLYANSQRLKEPMPSQFQGFLRRKWLQFNWRNMVGCGAYVCRTDTPLVGAWWTELNVRLDRLLPLLERNPAREPREGAGDFHGGGSSYPLPWTHINGSILQPLCLQYALHVSDILPTPRFRDYL